MDNSRFNKIARNLARAEIIVAKIAAKDDIITGAVLNKDGHEEINQKKPGHNGYIAHYKGRAAEVWAKSSFEAQTLAAAHFKAKKSHEVSVMLAEKADGSSVVHKPDF